jgi:hypothetical protein
LPVPRPLVEEIHVEVRLSDPEVTAVRRVILTGTFMSRLKNMVRDLIARDLATRVVRLRVTF